MFDVFVNTLPHFAAYFGTTVALFAAFLFLYTLITPNREFDLIKRGMKAPAFQMVGAALGYAIPVAVVTSFAVNIPDMVMWTGVVLVVQLATFFILSFVVDASRRIAEDCVGTGVFTGGMCVAVGILQAACMVP